MQRQSNLFLRCQNDYAFLLTFSLLKIYFHQAKNMLCTQSTKDYTHFLGFLLTNLLISHFLFILLSISYSYLILVFYLCFTLYLFLFCACFSTYNFKAMQIVIHVHIIILCLHPSVLLIQSKRVAPWSSRTEFLMEFRQEWGAGNYA